MSHITRENLNTKVDPKDVDAMKEVLETIHSDPSLKASYEAEKQRAEKIKEMTKNVDPKNVEAMKAILSRDPDGASGWSQKYDANRDNDMRSIIQKINYFANCDADVLQGSFSNLNTVIKQNTYLDMLFFGEILFKHLGDLEEISPQIIIGAIFETINRCEEIIIGFVNENGLYVYSGKDAPITQPTITPNFVSFLDGLKKLSYSDMCWLGEKIANSIEGKTLSYDRYALCFGLIHIIETLASKEKVILMKESEKQQAINKYLKGKE